MRFSLLVLTTLFTVACSSKPFKIKPAAQEVYSNGADRICPDIGLSSSSRKEAAYCLGWIYVQETDKNLPAIDQLGFKDIKVGDPTIPYVWVVVSTGIMKPDSPQEFGLQRPVSSEEWEDSMEKMQGLVKSWEKNAPSLRLK